MSKKAKEWLKDAGIRAGKTAAQTAISMLTIGQAVTDVNWVNVLSVSAVAAVYSLLMSFAGKTETDTDSEEQED